MKRTAWTAMLLGLVLLLVGCRARQPEQAIDAPSDTPSVRAADTAEEVDHQKVLKAVGKSLLRSVAGGGAGKQLQEAPQFGEQP